jgi:hypothetical protein
LTVRARSHFEFLNQSGFQVIRVRNHFARCNFFVGCALKAKLANAQSIFGANRGTKDATSHGTRFVELAKPSRWIECRARLIIREVSKASFRLFPAIQQPANRVSREILCQPGNRFPSALPRSCGSLRGALFQFREAFAEPERIELTYGKHANAALRTSGTAGEPVAASTRRISERRVHNLNQGLIASRQRTTHSQRIQQQGNFLSGWRFLVLDGTRVGRRLLIWRSAISN